jgi:hypothetical protein
MTLKGLFGLPIVLPRLQPNRSSYSWKIVREFEATNQFSLEWNGNDAPSDFLRELAQWLHDKEILKK